MPAWKDREYRRRQLCYLFLLFLVGCVVGWLYEEIFYYYTEGMLRNRGILFGPWLPIYGIGALCIYTMKPLKKHPLFLFLCCVLATGVVEFIIGYVGIHFFRLRLWDYRGLFGNIQGIVCFRSVVSFGVLGLLFHYLIEPFSEKMFRRWNPRVVYAACLLLALVFVTDGICSALFRTPITY